MNKESRAQLPIHEVLPKVHSTLETSNQLVLQAEPGAGKSTELPLSLLDAKWLQGKAIVMLEPRRVAAKSIAHFLAKRLGEKVGQRVGYQIKQDKKITGETRLEIVTEGILTRRLQSDPELNDIGLIIFDEFHERSLNSDLALLLSLEVQQTLREDLKLLVMSATIDTSMIAEYLGSAEVIHCPGTTFPVDVTYMDPRRVNRGRALTPQQRLIHDVASALPLAAQSSLGDILVFLPGQADISRCIEAAQEDFSGDEWVLLPLYGGLPLSQQEMALAPDKQQKRRIIFSTNIAETSLTIEGVTAVIDSGLEKTMIFDPVSGMSRLDTQRISRASSEQRAGRAGRTQAGVCYRLWTQEQHGGLIAYQPEEILTADLTGLRLELCEWGATQIDDLAWLTPPPKAHFDSAGRVLKQLGLFNDADHLTELGRKATSIGLSPRLSAMLLKAESEMERLLVCELAALLSERDIFYGRNGVDITDRLLALQDYQWNKAQAMKQYPLKRAVIEQCLQSVASYRRLLNVRRPKAAFSLADIQSVMGRLLLHAFPDRLAQQRMKNGERYVMANGRGARLSEQDGLFGSPWLVIAECDGQKAEGRIFQAVPIATEDIQCSLQGKTFEQFHVAVDNEKALFTAETRTTFGALTLSRSPLKTIPPEVFVDCVRQSIKDVGFRLFNWTGACESWLTRVEWLGRYLNDFPTVTRQSLVETVDDWLLPYLSDARTVAALKQVDLLVLLDSQLSWDEQSLLEQEAPTRYEAPSGRQVPITYDSQQGPMVSIPLQDMFGQLTSPYLAMGQVAMRFELLSPAKRPLQTTSDLANFWQSSYVEVAKEMRGRYPKHRWPEEPLKEQPGRSIKKR